MANSSTSGGQDAMPVPKERELWITVSVLGVLVLWGGWWLWSAQQALKAQAAQQQRVALARAQESVGVAPAPTVKRGPWKKVGAKKMSTWIVSDAGDATYDGTYTENGTNDGHPAYTNGAKWLFFQTTIWYLGDSKGDINTGYDGEATLPGTWSTKPPPGGDAPAPTVAEYVEEPGEYDWDDAPFVPDMPLAPGRVTLDGVPYIAFPLDSAGAQPVAHGFLLYDMNAGTWSTCASSVSLFGDNADDFNSAGTYDVGDGVHVWVSSGVWSNGDTPTITFKQFSVVPYGAAAVTDTDTLTLPSFDVTNFVQVSSGVFRFMLIDGSDISLCEYTAGSGTYSVVVTYGSGTGLPATYTATALVYLVSGPARTDQALFSRSDTLYWMRRCETGDPVTSRRVAAYTVDDTTCTLLADVLPDSSDHSTVIPPNDAQTQTWATFGTDTWGDLGRDDDFDTRLLWVPGDDATEQAPVAIEGVLRRWYLDDDLVLMCGWGDNTQSFRAFVYRAPRIYLVGHGEVSVDGEITELHITQPVRFIEDGIVKIEGDATLQVIYPVHLSGEGHVTIEGEATLIGAVHLSGDGEVTISGEGMLLVYLLPPSFVSGYSGGELDYKQPTTADKSAWQWKHTRPPGYDDRANRAFGALLGGIKVRTSPDADQEIDPLNKLTDDVIYCSWFTG